jgi:hypothetical protein
MFYNHSYQNRPKNNLMLEGTIEQLTFFTPIRVEYISRSNFYFRMMYCIYLSVFKWLNHDIHILIEKYYCFYNSHFFYWGSRFYSSCQETHILNPRRSTQQLTAAYPVICEVCIFTSMWKTLLWPYHFNKKWDLGLK